MKIRDFRDSDLDSVIEVYNRARTAAACFSSNNASRQDFSRLTANEEVMVATAGEALVGFISTWVPEKFVHHLYVEPTYHRRGVANALIKICVARHGLPLSLKSLVANTNACKYYESNLWVVEASGQGIEGAYNHYWLRNMEDS